MKHLLNDLTEKEKNSIREQHTGGMNVVTENFSKLINAKSGNVKPLVNEREGLDIDDYADDTDSITTPIMRILKPIHKKYGLEGVVDFLTDIIRDIHDVGDELFMGPDDYLSEQPLVTEDESSNGMIYLEDNGMEFPKDPNQWDKFYIRHFLTSGNFDSVEEANEKFQEIYGNPEFQFSVTFSGPAGSTVILTKGDEKIGGHYPVDFGGGIEADNRDRFSRSDDVFYSQNKRY